MYCTKCGRKLEDGEVCTCTQSAKNESAPQMRPVQHTQQTGQNEKDDQNIQAEHYASPNSQQTQYTTGQSQPGQNPNPAPRSVDTEKMKEKGTEILGMLKEMALDAVDVLKKPVSKSEIMVAEGSAKPGLRLLIAKCVIFLILLMIFFMKLNSELDGVLGLPYASAIILTLLLTVGLDSLEAWLLQVLSGAFKCNASVNAMFSVVSVRAVFETVITVVSAILMMASQKLGIGVFLAASLIIPFAEYASYRNIAEGDENKKVFAFAIVKICVILVALLVTYLLGQDMIASLQGRSTYYGF